MDLDFFGLDEDVSALEEQLAFVHGATRMPLLAALAWYLRQRDTRRALALADEVDALLAERPESADVERRRIEARVALVRGEGAWLLGDAPAALAFAGDAQSGFEAIGDRVGRGDALQLRANVGWFASESQDSDPPFSVATAAYRDAGDALRWYVGQTSMAVDDVFRDAEAAAKRWETTLASARDFGHPGLDRSIEFFQGQLHAMRGDHGRSAARFQRAQERALASGQFRMAIAAGRNVMVAHATLNDWTAALEWAERSLALARPTGWPASIGGALADLGYVLSHLGRNQIADEIMSEARAKLVPGSSFFAVACCQSAEIALNLGHYERALHWCREGANACRSRDWKAVLSDCLFKESQALLHLGRPEQAVTALDACLQAGDPRWRRDVFAAYAEIARRHPLPAPPGSTAASVPIHYMETALAEAGRTEGFTAPAEWFVDLSRDYEAVGDLARALDCERRAAVAREATHTRKATDLATSMQVRFETERARAEAAHHQALAQAEARRADAEAAANQAKSAFLANMSHELRSPLNAMLGFSRLVLRSASLDETARRDMAIVLRSGEHLYALINQVLELSKIESGRVALQAMPCHVQVLLDDLAQSFALVARQKGLALSLVAQPDVPTHVEVDALKLRQVLVNVLGNAIKFTERGGVELRVRAVDPQRLAFTVTDTGVGIEAEELAALGLPFMQAQAGREAAEGTGLGLAISRSFVRLMGGELRLASRPGAGTTVDFDIPVRVLQAVEASRREQSQRALRLAAGTPAPRVLVADDWAEGRQLLARLLVPLGFEVREATNGQEAIELWRQWEPHAICMDMRMPAMDGREATRRIKATEQGRETVIIAVTASSFEEQRAEILAQGCDDFLRKPFEEDVLLEMLARHLGLRYEFETPADAVHAAAADAALLAALPEEVRARLQAALARLNVQEVEHALQAVRAHDADAAAVLATMVERFQYQQAEALLAEATTGAVPPMPMQAP